MTEIIEQKRNPILNREEAWILVDHKGKPTPKREEVLKDVAKTLKKKEDLIIIEKVFTVAGKQESKVKVIAYEKKDDIPKVKLEMMERRNLPLGKRKPSKEDVKPADENAETPAEKPEKKDAPVKEEAKEENEKEKGE